MSDTASAEAPHRGVEAPALPVELTVVIPTFNERDNLAVLIARLDRALVGIAWEAIVVDDDSPDGTAALARALGTRDPRVRCIRRIGRRGLAGACLEGALAAAAPYVAVIDADLQHDETRLPDMLAALRDGADLAVGTRYAAGGTAKDGFGGVRAWGSARATALARRALGLDLSDPMSGFFMIRRERIEEIAPHLATDGFKILLDLVVSSPHPLKTVEISYRFRERHAGESKLDGLVALDYLGLVASKLSGGILPVRFFLFALIGASGVFVHLAALKTGLDLGRLPFDLAQTVATLVAMTSNFFLNNALTYRDRRLKGIGRILLGLLTFYAVCSVGAVANVGVAAWIFEKDVAWWAAGAAGAFMGAVFNYAASSVLTWRR